MTWFSELLVSIADTLGVKERTMCLVCILVGLGVVVPTAAYGACKVRKKRK